ncbi:bifunctional DNA primase/polymerase [Saccharomonospora azurea]|uniref:bifunctional DNA primase/polymerase n=1 Tax=Saccharomonospora azurea TaxID=40988 RepID=UPI003D8D3A83
MPTTSDNAGTVAAALDAATRGWRVFPLAPGGKQPVLHGRERCFGTGPCVDGHRGWEQRSTFDTDRIRVAWSRAAYNIGLATGPSGLCVLDLDAPKPGEAVPDELARQGVRSGEDMLAVVAEKAGQPVPSETLTVRTPSSGLHLYFTAPDGVQLRNTSGERGNGLGWKIDTRAWGGYVVAPGSRTAAGVYEFVYDGPVAPLPDWLVQRLVPAPPPTAPVTPIRPKAGRSRYVEAAIRAEAIKVRDAARGQRNAALYTAAVALGQLVAGGALSEAEHTEVLLAAARGHINVGAYSETQARKTIASGLHAGMRRPRRIA